MVTQEELEKTRNAWDSIAAGFDTFVTPAGNWAMQVDALSRVGLRPEMRFLDVASGSGRLSIPAAQRGARVLAVDLSPAMIERLNARAQAEGLSNLEGRVMDGHALELEDNTFDIAASQFGVMLFPDLPRALREMVRVTRPGGRVLVISWRPPNQIEFLSFFIDTMKAVVPGFEGLPADPPPLAFQVADPEVLRQKMVEAGLQEVRVESGAERLEFRSGAELWDWVANGNPVAAGLVANLTEEQKAAVRQALDEKLRRRADPSGNAVVNNPVNIGIGRK